jgi:hypothetical protein
MVASATARAYWIGLGFDTDDIRTAVDFKGQVSIRYVTLQFCMLMVIMVVI